ncbi:MAG TPA: undecaprenyl-phosphate glucose phosphotransferase [Azospirillaceae bacterium]|nr:undecaprenyl-phosphate glucose phosphotransferase [Azospirillaceae bacterium]
MAELSEVQAERSTPLAHKPIPISAIDYAARGADVLAIIVTGIAAYILLGDRIPPTLHAQYLNTTVLGAIVAAIVFEWLGVYDIGTWFRPAEGYRRMLTGWTMSGAVLVVFGFALKITEDYSRLWASVWFFGTFLSLVVTRTLVRTQVRRMKARGAFDARVVIVGADEQAERLARFIAQSRALTMRVVGFVDERAEGGTRAIDGIPVSRGLEPLMRMIRREEVDQVILALPWQDERRIHDLVARVAMTPVRIRLAPDLAGYNYPHRSFTLLDGLPVLNLFERPISGFSYVVKEIEDKVIAALALVLLSPALLAIAAAVKLDSPGPVFFRQDRVGFNDRVIRVWKFRSMRTDMCEADNIRQASREDPRITRVGRILRRTSLDELPQLFNVLSGEMSIVGPRPHAPSTRAAGRYFDQIVDSYAARHRVKPGITGWAQVNGWRGETDTEEKLIRRVEHDLHYIENWSVGFDLYIMLRTALTVFGQRNAY